MQLPALCAIALATSLALAGHDSAHAIDFSVTPHWQEPVTVNDGQTRVFSPEDQITLSQDSFVTIRVEIDSTLPFTIGAAFDNAALLSSPNHFDGGSTQATFSAHLGAGVHEFFATFSLPSASMGDTTAFTQYDFSAAPVPEPAMPLMLLAGLGCLIAHRRWNRPGQAV